VTDFCDNNRAERFAKTKADQGLAESASILAVEKLLPIVWRPRHHPNSDMQADQRNHEMEMVATT
jgi:hypothetical protein